MTKRILSLDSFKAISAFMIIFLHYGVAGAGIINAYFRIAVLFFFMVSGYFLYSVENGVIIKKGIKALRKITKIYLIVLGALIVKSAAMNLVKGNSNKLINALTSKEFIFFNFNFASYLWFLRALIYVYIVILSMFWIIRDKKFAERIIFVISTLLIIASVIFCKYAQVFGINISPDAYEIPCKFLSVAFGGFGIGFFVGKYQEYINDKVKVSAAYFLVTWGGG